MPLMPGKSKQAFGKNVATEMKSGRPQKQALAIAYAQRKKMKSGGMMKAMKMMAEGGPVEEDTRMREGHQVKHKGMMQHLAASQMPMMADGGEIPLQDDQADPDYLAFWDHEYDQNLGSAEEAYKHGKAEHLAEGGLAKAKKKMKELWNPPMAPATGGLGPDEDYSMASGGLFGGGGGSSKSAPAPTPQGPSGQDEISSLDSMDKMADGGDVHEEALEKAMMKHLMKKWMAAG